MSGSRRAGALVIGDEQVNVNVIDESSGGFAVEVDRALDCRMDDRLMLRVGDDWFKVRVVFVELQDLGVEQFMGNQLTSRTRLGFMRLADEQYWEVTRHKGTATLKTTRVFLRKNSLLAAAAGIVAGLLVIGAALTSTLKRSKPLDPVARERHEARDPDIRDPLVLAPKAGLSLERKVRDGLRPVEGEGFEAPAVPNLDVLTEKRTAKRDQEKENETAEKHNGPFVPSMPDNMVDEKIEDSTAAADSSVKAIEPEKINLRVSQPEYLLRPDVAKSLGLSEAQKVQLLRLAGEQRMADQSLSSAVDSDDAPLVMGRRCWGILTSQQRRLLVDLLKQLPPQTSPDDGASTDGPDRLPGAPTTDA